MTGDDRDETWDGPQPAFVLVNPQMGENIGGAARAMWNFGLERMRVVAPRDGWPNPKAVAMASGAGRLLDRAGLFAGTSDAVADLNFVFATTARPRELTKPVVSPERAMEQARSMIAEGQQVGVLFGPERAGLTNDDVARANAIISVPVNPAFPSLNLAQCVLLTAYEWRRQSAEIIPEAAEMARTRYASAGEVAKLVERYENTLEAAHFFWPEHKAASMRRALRNMFGRLPLTLTDVQMLHGIMRRMARRDGTGRDGDEET
ncbi:RNA methyltransferase [Maritimibacter sp. 55A14]|uniref:RNA methyltransferase n=1 Tax=Maritimibacter sp. 55A14 TaxID=2174844 RepID=UPI000D60D891|nr:RNA methyltransferase [Maritimibacter sp. 55A14]PWE33063.1 RNA methyltransferase [Maritimibacter sp. 55A14]